MLVNEFPNFHEYITIRMTAKHIVHVADKVATSGKVGENLETVLSVRNREKVEKFWVTSEKSRIILKQGSA